MGETFRSDKGELLSFEIDLLQTFCPARLERKDCNKASASSYC